MSDLQKYLNYFVYSSIVSNELIDAIKSEEKFMHDECIKKGLFEKREHANLDDRELLRMNSLRYAEGFKILQNTKNAGLVYRNIDYMVQTMGLTLNTNAFLVTIELLGLKKQVEHWRKQVLQGRVIGAYGQTELGHGSNVQMLQTVATYKKERRTWTINSPTVTSAKFWPGVLGIFSTHTVLQAKAIVDGKSLGVQTFVIEIRDKNLEALPNVEGFDIGPKLGFERVDNGGLILKNVQVPREAMLMRYVQVEEDGRVVGLENKEAIKYGYGSMLNLRVQLTYSFAIAYGLVPTISQYLIFKEMGIQKGEAERKLIVESCCYAYGVIIANNHTKSIFKNFIKEIEQENYPQADKHLLNCHIISSTLKALTSWMSIDLSTNLMIKTKYGVFKTSQIPYAWSSVIPAATYEGDNSVLLQQTAKFLLMKSKTEKLPKPNTTVHTNNLEEAIATLSYIVAEETAKLKKKIEVHSEKGAQFQTIWNEKIQKSMIELSLIWGKLRLLIGMDITLKAMKTHRSFFLKVCQVLSNYLLHGINEVELYGFKLVDPLIWNTFSEEQFNAMIYINAPIEREVEGMKFIERPSEDWIQAKL